MKKKTVFFLFGFVTLLLLFSSCLSTDAPSYNMEQDGSPEDSVVVYGALGGRNLVNIVLASQMNLKKEPKKIYYITGKNSCIWFVRPVKMGERYKAIYADVTESYRWQYSRDFRLDEKSCFDFTVQSKPGLQFVGLNGSEESSPFFDEKKYSKATDDEKKILDAKLEIGCLTGMQKFYSNSSWESVIQNRLDELNKLLEAAK